MNQNFKFLNMHDFLVFRQIVVKRKKIKSTLNCLSLIGEKDEIWVEIWNNACNEIHNFLQCKHIIKPLYLLFAVQIASAFCTIALLHGPAQPCLLPCSAPLSPSLLPSLFFLSSFHQRWLNNSCFRIYKKKKEKKKEGFRQYYVLGYYVRFYGFFVLHCNENESSF